MHQGVSPSAGICFIEESFQHELVSVLICWRRVCLWLPFKNHRYITMDLLFWWILACQPNTEKKSGNANVSRCQPSLKQICCMYAEFRNLYVKGWCIGYDDRIQLRGFECPFYVCWWHNILWLIYICVYTLPFKSLVSVSCSFFLFFFVIHQQGCIKMMKSGSKYIYSVIKDFGNTLQ